MKHAWFSSFALIAIAAPMLRADSIVFRDGKKSEGTLLGASSRQIEFLTVGGQRLQVPIQDVSALNFYPVKSKAAQQGRGAVVIPAGTLLRVRVIDTIDVDSTQAGMKFRASLDDVLLSGGSVVAPRGADVLLIAAKVEQGGKFKGSDLIQLKAVSVSVNGKPHPVVTSLSQTKSEGEGGKTARKTGLGAGLGAIIGGIAGGGAGAGIGALAGAAGGTVLSATGQPHLKIPSETRLEFQLLADWKIQ